MIPNVTSLAEARNWFLSHSSGSVKCIRPDGREMIVSTYGDAEDFFAWIPTINTVTPMDAP